MSDQTLTDAQAISLLQRYESEMRAFRQVSAVIDKFKEAKNALAKMDAEIAARKGDLESIEQRIAGANMDLAKVHAIVNAERVKADGEIKAINSDVAAFKAKLEAARSAFNDFEAKVAEDRKALEEMTKAKAVEFEALKKAFDAFKAEHKL